MAASDIDKLMAMFERLQSQQPVINVNISLDGLLSPKKKKPEDEAVSGPEVNQPDVPTPSGYPRPYIS